jgi:hypothetical protein
MKRTLVVSSLIAAVGLISTTRTGAASGPAPADTTRTVYFGATDSKGASITDLTAADITVKEGGKDRAVATLAAATGPLDMYVLVDDRGTGAYQGAVGQFLQTMVGHGKFAIAVMNPQPIKVADFIDDVEGLRAALGRLGQRGKVQTDTDQIIQAVSGAAKELQSRKSARPVIVVMTATGETALADRVDSTLNDLKFSGASLNVVYYTGVELGKLLGDGPKQSGGVSVMAGSGTAIGPAVARIMDNLLHQYAVTYTLPEGVKPSDRFAIATTRKGVTLIAPTRINDK